MNIVVAFGSFEHPGMEHNGVQLARRGCNGQYGCECIVRLVVLPQLQAGSFFKLIISGSIKMLKMYEYL